jgi:hypothetical protein
MRCIPTCKETIRMALRYVPQIRLEYMAKSMLLRYSRDINRFYLVKRSFR